MDKWWSSRLDKLGAIATNVHAGRVVTHGLQSRDPVRLHPLCLSSPVREALLTLELGKCLEKVGQTKPAHTKLASLPQLAGCPSLVVRTKSKSKIWPSPHGIFKLCWTKKFLITQRDALHLLLVCLKITMWTLQLSRSQGLLEKAHFVKRKEDTHSSGLAGLKENEGNLEYAWLSRTPLQQSCWFAYWHKWLNPDLAYTSARKAAPHHSQCLCPNSDQSHWNQGGILQWAENHHQ